MKKCITLGAILAAALLVSSCKSSQESAYKRAYEKAQLGQQADTQQTLVTPVVSTTTTPVEVTPAATTSVIPTVDPNSVSVRTESVTLVNGAGLQAYNVVCGSFKSKANADGLQQVLKSAGYPAQVVVNPATGMYRVVATTHSDKVGAIQSRETLRAQYPDAWLLLNQ